MRAMTKRVVAVVGFAVLASAGLPAAASAGGARLYEMTENMKLTTRGKFDRRQATSQLIGTADIGTPLCPQALVALVSPAATSCTVNATGSDNVSLATGLGTFSGEFTVLAQGDNDADSPEFVVMKGSFKGKMDFSPAILYAIPLGSVVGTMKAERGPAFPFTGTFRLPFVIKGVQADGSPCTPGAEAPGCFPLNDAAVFGALPLPLTPMERYDLTQTTRPLYLQNDGSVLPVQSSEFGGGWAAVKFEIGF
jgi:hypothetical protein